MMLTSPPEPSELERARARHDEVVGRARQIKRQRSATVGAVVVAVVLLAVAVPLAITRGTGEGREVVTTSPPPSPSTSAAPTTTGGSSGSTSTTTPTTLAAPLARVRRRRAPPSPGRRSDRAGPWRCGLPRPRWDPATRSRPRW